MMSKPASRTVSYIVYPPNYKPGDGYVKVKNKKAALKQAIKYGTGAEVDREISTKNKRHSIYGRDPRGEFVLKS